MQVKTQILTNVAWCWSFRDCR